MVTPSFCEKTTRLNQDTDAVAIEELQPPETPPDLRHAEIPVPLDV